MLDGVTVLVRVHVSAIVVVPSSIPVPARVLVPTSLHFSFRAPFSITAVAMHTETAFLGKSWFSEYFCAPAFVFLPCYLSLSVFQPLPPSTNRIDVHI